MAIGWRILIYIVCLVVSWSSLLLFWILGKRRPAIKVLAIIWAVLYTILLYLIFSKTGFKHYIYWTTKCSNLIGILLWVVFDALDK